MVRWCLLIIAVVMLALLGLNVLLTIGIITRHPFEWLGGALAFYAASSLPFADYYPRGHRAGAEETR